MSIQAKRHDNGVHERTIRASISFPEEQYQVLERIATENKVSLAWVVRDAVDGYLKSKWPLSRKVSAQKMRSREAREREKNI